MFDNSGDSEIAIALALTGGAAGFTAAVVNCCNVGDSVDCPCNLIVMTWVGVVFGGVGGFVYSLMSDI